MKKIPILFFSISFLFFTAFQNIVIASSTRQVELNYIITLKDIPSTAKKLRLWFPLVPENGLQSVEDFQVQPTDNISFHTGTKYGNSIGYYEADLNGKEDLTIWVHYRIKRFSFPYKMERKSSGEEDLHKYLLVQRFVPQSPEIRQMAAFITTGKKGTIEKAGAIYDYVYDNLALSTKVPGWGYGNVERAILLKSGDSTDFHSLFIALARGIGIPARFVIGVALPTQEGKFIRGYYSWAEFYDRKQGWIPVDIAKAKETGERDKFFGRLDADRIEFTHGRDIILDPPQEEAPLNFFIYPYAEIDGKIFRNMTVTFQHKNLP